MKVTKIIYSRLDHQTDFSEEFSIEIELSKKDNPKEAIPFAQDILRDKISVQKDEQERIAKVNSTMAKNEQEKQAKALSLLNRVHKEFTGVYRGETMIAIEAALNRTKKDCPER